MMHALLPKCDQGAHTAMTQRHCECTLAVTVENEIGSCKLTSRGGHITGLGVGVCPIFGAVLLGTEGLFFLQPAHVCW
jgi:hypothetical protein